jgi:cytochrome P450
MTETLTDIPAYPMRRADGCPFDPPPELNQLLADEPVSRVRIWDGSTPWLFTRYADQRAILADPRFSADPAHSGYPDQGASFAARRAESSSFINMDNPDHDRYRRMLTRAFTIKRVEGMRPRIQAIVDGLIDDMVAAGPPADLVRDFALPVPSLVICELLGVPYADHDFFQQRSKVLVAKDVDPADSVAAMRDLKGYLSALVERKMAEPTDDVLGHLARTQLAAGEMTLDDAANMAVLLLIAGHETTANMIALGTLALLRHPEQLAELRAADDSPESRTLVAGAVEELLRYLNIVHSGRRRVATEDVEIGGVLVRAGEGVVLPNDIANRDAAAFPDQPDDLDIHRSARHHVAFGFGIHQCLGQPLARVELQVVYSTLYRRLPELALAVGLDEIPFKHDMLIYGVHELPVTW